MASSQARRTLGITLTIVSTVIFLAFLFLLFADAVDVNVSGRGAIKEIAIAGAILFAIVSIILFVLLFIRESERREAAAEDAVPFFVPTKEEQIVAKPRGSKRTVLVFPDLARLRHSVRLRPLRDDLLEMSFPFYTDRGLYVTDTVDDGRGRNIEVRTLIACHPDDANAHLLTASSKTKHTVKKTTIVTTEQTIEPKPEPKQIVESHAWDTPPTAMIVPPPSPIVKREQTVVLAAAPAPAKPTPKPTPKPKPKKVESIVEPIADEATELYYDYRGDVHDVIDVEGIGEIYSTRLVKAGVKTTSRLCYLSTEEIAKIAKCAPGEAESWRRMAQLMKVNGIGPQYAEVLVRAGIEGIQDLKDKDAELVANTVTAYIATRDDHMIGVKITARRVAGWKEAAKPMRRVRNLVPSE